MSVKRQPRSEWTKRPSAATVQGSPRRGVAVHWPGFRLVINDHDDCLKLLARLERDALNDQRNDYTAVPYNQAACVHGYLIEGRGANRRSGANGSTLANRDYGSVVALISTDRKGDLPRPLLEAVRGALIVQAPRGRLVTHRDVRPEPTACPGPRLTDWVKDGARLPANAPAKARTYTVKAGETLWGLAERLLGDGGKWEQLAKLNGLASPEDLEPGQKLRLP